MEERGIATRQGTHAPVLTEPATRNRYGLDGASDFPRAVVAERPDAWRCRCTRR